MSAQRYEFELYHCNGGEMLVSDAGDYVSYEDYAALEARCAALAAENAGLKKYICDECYVENVSTGRYACAGHSMPSTPATDAFLAEVRAQGVEMFGDHLRKKGSNPIVCKMIALGADEFAAQLRQDANTAELVAAGIITRIED